MRCFLLSLLSTILAVRVRSADRGTESHTVSYTHKHRHMSRVIMTDGDNFTVGTLPGVGRVLFASRDIKVITF